MAPSGRAQAFRWLFSFILGFGFWQCATDPPIEPWIQLKLNDSLSRFDSVHIDILDPADPSRVLQVVWAGPLANPANMKEVKLTFTPTNAYQVRIRAWNEEKELGWETIIVQKGDSSEVHRTVLPPLRPYLVELANLSFSESDLEPGFQPARTSYNLNVGFLIDSLTVLPTPVDSRAQVAIMAGTDTLGSDSARFKVKDGISEVTVRVTNKGNRLATYKVFVIKAPTPDPRLRSLTTSSGKLVPDFNPETSQYKLSLGYSASRLSFPIFVADSFATVIVNQDTLMDGRTPNSIGIPVGISTIQIKLSIAEKRMDYNIEVTRADTVIDTTKPPVIIIEPPRLLGLAFNEGPLLPPFNDLVHEYQMTVDDTIAFAQIKTLSCDTGITVELPNDTLACGETPKPLPLKEGSNVVNIRMVDNKTKADTLYTVTIQRKQKFRLSGFANSARIRVNTTATGANVLGRVTGYPLLLRLRKGNFDFSSALPDGRDIRIVKPDGTLLPREIDYWDSASGLADVWVRVDTIPGNSIKDIAYLCWGNPSADSVVQPSPIFSSADGFAAVWHMDTAFNDASRNGNKGYPRMNAACSTGGLVGRALKTNGINQGVEFGNGSSISVLTTAIQFEGWIRTRQAGVAATVFRHDMHLNALALQAGPNPLTTLHTRFTDTTRAADSLKALPFELSSNYDDDAWHQIVVQYESTTGLIVFWDGRVVASNTKIRGPLNTSQKSYMVGITENNTNPFNGFTDEVRIQSKVRSSDWVKLNFEALKPASSVIRFIP